MATQLNLVFEAPKRARTGGMPDWMKDRLRPRYRQGAKYNPKGIRRLVLNLLQADEWKGFIDLSTEVEDALGQHTDQVIHVVDFLQRKGRVESTPLYFLKPSLGAALLEADRLQRPSDEAYRGFEFGYLLKLS